MPADRKRCRSVCARALFLHTQSRPFISHVQARDHPATLFACVGGRPRRLYFFFRPTAGRWLDEKNCPPNRCSKKKESHRPQDLSHPPWVNHVSSVKSSAGFVRHSDLDNFSAPLTLDLDPFSNQDDNMHDPPDTKLFQADTPLRVSPLSREFSSFVVNRFLHNSFALCVADLLFGLTVGRSAVSHRTFFRSLFVWPRLLLLSFVRRSSCPPSAAAFPSLETWPARSCSNGSNHVTPHYRLHTPESI